MVVHLSPSIKHLLIQRNPSVLPGPLNSILASTFRDARTRNAKTGWLVLTTCTLLTANRPSAVSHLYRFVTGSAEQGDEKEGVDIPHAVNLAAIMRETMLKSVIFLGVPRVILSLSALHEAMDDRVRNALRTHSRRSASPDNIQSIVTRGQGLWDSIYAPHADKLHDKLGSYHPDFISIAIAGSPNVSIHLSDFPFPILRPDVLTFPSAFIIQCYGSILSPLPGGTKTYMDGSTLGDLDQGNLSRTLGSVVGVATLRSEGRVGPQLTSHIFGLLKARYSKNLNSEDEFLSSDVGTEWVIRTVDEILDVLSADSDSAICAKL